jgi:hypothetical protein
MSRMLIAIALLLPMSAVAEESLYPPPVTQCSYPDGTTRSCFDPHRPDKLRGTITCAPGVEPSPDALSDGWVPTLEQIPESGCRVDRVPY